MPVVIKRDETGKDPKAKKAAVPAKKSAANAQPGAKPKPGGKNEPNEMPRIIIAVSVILLAIVFGAWWMFSGGSSTPVTGTTQTKVDRTPSIGGEGGGAAAKSNKGGGISTDEAAPTALSGRRGLGKGTEGGSEGIP